VTEPWEPGYAGERLTVTLKAGKDFSDPWVVFHGGSTDEVLQELAKLQNDETLLKATSTVATAFHRVYVEAKGGAPAPTQQPSQAPAQQAAPPPQPQAQTAQAVFCGKCGQQMTYKEGTGQKGPWKGYFCSDRDHGPRFVKKDGGLTDQKS
jgi:hypothetical protein